MQSTRRATSRAEHRLVIMGTAQEVWQNQMAFVWALVNNFIIKSNHYCWIKCALLFSACHWSHSFEPGVNSGSTFFIISQLCDISPVSCLEFWNHSSLWEHLSRLEFQQCGHTWRCPVEISDYLKYSFSGFNELLRGRQPLSLLSCVIISIFTIKCATIEIRQLHRCVTACQHVGVHYTAASWLIFSGGELVTDTSLLQTKKEQHWLKPKALKLHWGKLNKFALKLDFLSLQTLKRVQSCRNLPAAAVSRWWRDLHHSPAWATSQRPQNLSSDSWPDPRCCPLPEGAYVVVERAALFFIFYSRERQHE